MPRMEEKAKIEEPAGDSILSYLLAMSIKE